MLLDLLVKVYESPCDEIVLCWFDDSAVFIIRNVDWWLPWKEIYSLENWEIISWFSFGLFFRKVNDNCKIDPNKTPQNLR